jgi:hypothetical protein
MQEFNLAGQRNKTTIMAGLLKAEGERARDNADFGDGLQPFNIESVRAQMQRLFPELGGKEAPPSKAPQTPEEVAEALKVFSPEEQERRLAEAEKQGRPAEEIAKIRSLLGGTASEVTAELETPEVSAEDAELDRIAASGINPSTKVNRPSRDEVIANFEEAVAELRALYPGGPAEVSLEAFRKISGNSRLKRAFKAAFGDNSLAELRKQFQPPKGVARGAAR